MHDTYFTYVFYLSFPVPEVLKLTLKKYDIFCCQKVHKISHTAYVVVLVHWTFDLGKNLDLVQIPLCY